MKVWSISDLTGWFSLSPSHWRPTVRSEKRRERRCYQTWEAWVGQQGEVVARCFVIKNMEVHMNLQSIFIIIYLYHESMYVVWSALLNNSINSKDSALTVESYRNTMIKGRKLLKGMAPETMKKEKTGRGGGKVEGYPWVLLHAHHQTHFLSYVRGGLRHLWEASGDLLLRWL